MLVAKLLDGRPFGIACPEDLVDEGDEEDGHLLDHRPVDVVEDGVGRRGKRHVSRFPHGMAPFGGFSCFH